MTHRATTAPVSATKILWREALARMEPGEKLLVHNTTQAKAGGAVARYNTNGRRFVTKQDPRGVYVIRLT